MADLVQPSVFSKIAHQWLYKQKRESVIFVMNTMKTSCRNQAQYHLQTKFGKSKKVAAAIVNENSFDCSTGFVMGYHEGTVYILTCCHSLKQFYSSTAPLTAEQIDWFNIKVLCIHQEDYLASTNSALYSNPSADPRLYTTANVLKFNGSKDLMVLGVSMEDLCADNVGNRCLQPHPPLKFAESVPPQLNDVIMISWPPLLCDTVVSGEVSNKSRFYNQVSSVSNQGYDMFMIELNMNGRVGCSGSPILNHNGEVIAVYHGRLHDTGYAVSFRDVINFLGPIILERISG